MSVPAIPRPRCPVCGSDVDVPAWSCSRCETPHHADCAEYFGGCAIFACRDSHLPSNVEVASWPESLRCLSEIASIQKWKVRALAGLFGFSGLTLLCFVLPWWVLAYFPSAMMPVVSSTAFLMFFAGTLLVGKERTLNAQLLSSLNKSDLDRTITSFRRAQRLLPGKLPRSPLWWLTKPNVVIGLTILLIPIECVLFVLKLDMAAAAFFFLGVLGVLGLINLNDLLDGQHQLEFLARTIQSRGQAQEALEAKPTIKQLP